MILQRHFDAISEAYYDIVDRVWYDVGYYHLREAEVVRHRVRSAVKVAIDAGCGPGRHTVFLASRATRVVAIDFSRKMLELAFHVVGDENRRRVDFVQADVRHLPLKQGVADLIVNLEVLEHLPGDHEGLVSTFSEFHRILKPGGSVLVEAPLSRHSWWRLLKVRPPSWKEIPARMRREYMDKVPLAVERVFKENDIGNLIRRSGFHVVGRDFVRVLPAGLVERHPYLGVLDRILERVPVAQRFAREALWLVCTDVTVSGGGHPMPLRASHVGAADEAVEP